MSTAVTRRGDVTGVRPRLTGGRVPVHVSSLSNHRGRFWPRNPPPITTAIHTAVCTFRLSPRVRFMELLSRLLV